jgi:hypothetical protein
LRLVRSRLHPLLVGLLPLALVVGLSLGLAPSAQAAAGPVIAWVPSHQNDTGANGWHEYAVCGDIVQRTMAELPEFTNVLCWETGMGLTSQNYPALRSEIAQAVAAKATIMISIHVDGDTPSGLGGCYFLGDTSSGDYGNKLLKSMAATSVLPYLVNYGRKDVYILDPANNPVPIRVLLELGDNKADRALLDSTSGRQKLADALASAVRDNTPPRTRYEQTSTKLGYSGSWTSLSASGASGGSYAYADSPASVDVRFTGTSLDWIATTGTTQGKAQVSLDGGAPAEVDLSGGTTLRCQKVWSTGGLGAGAHRVVISWTGHPGVKGGTRVNVDAFDVIGTLDQAPGLILYQQSAPQLTYAGTWISVTTSSASGGSFTYAKAAGSSVTVRFTGTSLAWIAKTGPLYGLAKVTVDGGTPVMADLYSATVAWKRQVWDTGTLAAGRHTVLIEWTGAPSVAGGGGDLDVDAFRVQGSLN